MSVFDIVTGSKAQNAGSSIASALVTKRPVATANAAQANDAPATGTTTGQGSGSATITSNDFMTLLVSELQNQDPTAPTDPNAYITQMVGVNSLQQLISINQGITTLQPTTTKATGGVVSAPPADGALPAAKEAIAASTDATAAAQIRSAALASMNLS